MEPERIELSTRERERLKVLHEVEEGHLKQIEAARRLRLTDRQVRRLLVRLSREAGCLAYSGKMSVPVCTVLAWKLRSAWTVCTGCASAAVICPSSPVRSRRNLQVLPAYGLQGLQIKNKNPKPPSRPNTPRPPIILGVNLGTGHFHLAENRTFLLCVDSTDPRGTNKKDRGCHAVLALR
jgi:hypothetical protein